MPDPETLRDRVAAALAEAGWPDAEVVKCRCPDPNCTVSVVPTGVPLEAIWTAFLVAGTPTLKCWPCFSPSALRSRATTRGPCPHDPWEQPRPQVPRREEAG